MAEKKRPKAESFFQTKALDVSASDDDMARLKKRDQAIKVLVVWLVHEGLGASLGLSLLPSILYLSKLGRYWLLGSRAGSCRKAGH